MANLSEIYIKKETLETMLKVLSKKQGDEAKGIKITISQSDETNQFGQNVTAYVAQTKEQREAKAEKFYVGNGKVFWTKGETPIATIYAKQGAPGASATSANAPDNLPF